MNKLKRMNGRERTFLLITIPILALFFCFNTLPLIRGYGEFDWVGIRNYTDLFTDARVGKSYLFTFKLAIVATIVVNVLSLVLALGLNSKIKFKSALRGMYFVPNILGALVVGYIFNYFFTYILPAVVKMMGGTITYDRLDQPGEPAADITVQTSDLKGCVIKGSLIPKLIDEIPIIAIMACFAKGQTVIKDAQELKVKESNRIDVMVKNLSAMGADISATDDGMIIHGGKPLHGAVIDSHLDHRIAMSFAIAGLNADGDTEILGSDCVNISYPTFYQDLAGLR